MSHDPIVIAGYARTPMGGMQGVFGDVKSTDLGAAAVRAAVYRSGVDAGAIEQIFMGCVLPAGLGQAPARQADELGKKFVEAKTGDRIEGKIARRIDMASGRFALIEKSREFTLVPWRPVLEKQIGKQASGVLREGGISWAFGRGRTGPEIS